MVEAGDGVGFFVSDGLGDGGEPILVGNAAGVGDGDEVVFGFGDAEVAADGAVNSL